MTPIIRAHFLIFNQNPQVFHTLISTSLILVTPVATGYKYVGEIKEIHMRNIIQETSYHTC